MHTIEEINSNPIFKPPAYMLNGIGKHPAAKMIKKWFKNPYLFYGYQTSIGQTFAFPLRDIGKSVDKKVFRYEGQLFEMDDEEHKRVYEKYVTQYHKERFEETLKEENGFLKRNDSNYSFTWYDIELTNKRWDDYDFTFKLYGKYKKGTLLKDTDIYKNIDVDNKSPLKKYAKCFNIIEKEFKLISERKRDFYKKYFTYKAFTAFEECGIEVLYAKKGYSIDGKRLPSFNRGSVDGLKKSLKENKIKQKGITKKDDIIKVLLKL